MLVVISIVWYLLGINPEHIKVGVIAIATWEIGQWAGETLAIGVKSKREERNLVR
jgi:hypothetical protein